jgi:anti-anti-sigma factor
MVFRVEFPADDGIVRLHGELDVSVAREFRGEFESYIRRAQGDVVVDCSDLSFIDSSGSVVLLAARVSLSEDRRKLSLFGLQPAPRRALELLGLSDLFAD